MFVLVVSDRENGDLGLVVVGPAVVFPPKWCEHCEEIHSTELCSYRNWRELFGANRYFWTLGVN